MARSVTLTPTNCYLPRRQGEIFQTASGVGILGKTCFETPQRTSSIAPARLISRIASFIEISTTIVRTSFSPNHSATIDRLDRGSNARARAPSCLRSSSFIGQMDTVILPITIDILVFFFRRNDDRCLVKQGRDELRSTTVFEIHGERQVHSGVYATTTC